MDQLKKIRLAANGFYNVGLERAKIRDLTGAAEALKKCLMLRTARPGFTEIIV